MVVNDAILQLTGYRLPDLVQTVFADQPISTIFSDNRDGIVLSTQLPPVEKGFGFGGGFFGRRRQYARSRQLLADGLLRHVKTDASGHASMAFTMPDDLDDLARDGDRGRERRRAFRYQRRDLHLDAAAVHQPAAPAVRASGDTFGAGVSVTNQTGANGSLALMLKLSGALSFASGDPHSESATEQLTDPTSGSDSRSLPERRRRRPTKSPVRSARRTTRSRSVHGDRRFDHRFGDRNRRDRQAGKHSAGPRQGRLSSSRSPTRSCRSSWSRPTGR